MIYELANSQRQGSREEQEDAAGFTDPRDPAVRHAGVLGVLSDGMGGMSYGSTAAQLTVRSFLEAYRKKEPSEAIPSALLRSLLEANRAVLGFARSIGGKDLAAATVVAAVLKGQELHWISAGDSRAYLVRGGAIFRLTVDHTIAEDRRFLSAAANPNSASVETVDPEAVSSFMGLPGTPRTDGNHWPFRLASDDCVLLASDGLYKSLGESEIPALMTGDVRRDCESLVQAVLKRGVKDQDNVTVMAMKYRDGRLARQASRWWLPRLLGWRR